MVTLYVAQDFGLGDKDARKGVAILVASQIQ